MTEKDLEIQELKRKLENEEWRTDPPDHDGIYIATSFTKVWEAGELRLGARPSDEELLSPRGCTYARNFDGRWAQVAQTAFINGQWPGSVIAWKPMPKAYIK